MVVWALGQMSGTSMDGIDLALLRTDGGARLAPGPARVVPYDAGARRQIRAGLAAARACESRRLHAPADWPEAVRRAAEVVTRAHLAALGGFLRSVGERPELLGYHGQTLLHRPQDQLSLQVGSAETLAGALDLPVAHSLRQADLAAGGEGAPLAPFFHHAVARAAGLRSPTAFLNLGGIGNVTLVDPALAEPDAPGAVLAFDTGPGIGLLDDWVAARGGGAFDRDGALARGGRVSEGVLATLLDQPYFRAPPPKSLDRGAFDLAPLAGLSPADGAATLVAFTAATVALAEAELHPAPTRWLACGGGRRNPAVMDAIAHRLRAPLAPVDEIGWNGDLLEAWAFAWLGLRVRDGRSLSAPTTTGCRRPAIGGRLALPAGAA